MHFITSESMELFCKLYFLWLVFTEKLQWWPLTTSFACMLKTPFFLESKDNEPTIIIFFNQNFDRDSVRVIL